MTSLREFIIQDLIKSGKDEELAIRIADLQQYTKEENEQFFEEYNHKKATERSKEITDARLTSIANNKTYENRHISKTKFTEMLSPNVPNIVVKRRIEFVGERKLTADYSKKRLKKVLFFYEDHIDANPLYYNPDSLVPKQLGDSHSRVAKDIIEKNEGIVDFFKSKGYQVKVVWESDFLKDDINVIEECAKFLNS